MTYAELITKITPDERKVLRERIEKIIGTKEQAKLLASSLSERINNATQWQKQYEALAKVFLEHGEKTLSMHYIQRGSRCDGVTVSGKKWIYEGNNGFTSRSRYCGSLYIEGEGTIFTSGRIDKVFDYVLSN